MITSCLSRYFVGFFAILVLAGCSTTPPVDPPTSANTPAPAVAETATTLPTLLPVADTAVPTPAASPIPFQRIRNIHYNSAQLPDQKLDVYTPNPVVGLTPVILTVHGGGGDKGNFSRFAIHFTELGYAVVSINYREMPKYTYPAPMDDTFCALAWIYANADQYQFDTRHIAAVGHSLGGTFVAALGTMADSSPFIEHCPYPLPDEHIVQAVVTFTGVFDYQASTDSLLHYYTDFFGASPEDAPELWKNASPVTWVDAGTPPFLLIHGANDTNILPEHSVNFAAELADADVEHQLLIIPNASHNTIIDRAASYQAVSEFLYTAFKR